RYVVSCQVYKKMKTGKNTADKEKAEYIDRLARDHRGLRIAYVDAAAPVYRQEWSVLLRWSPEKREMEKEYEVTLPGDILVGEAKPNNQNHAIIFTRGEAVQAIDMNQDSGLEDALKCRQLMAEFGYGDDRQPGKGLGRIVGYREHVFTHNVSSVAQFFSLQELNFVTASQRVVADPLAVRFHYGHPDLFDKVTAVTMGGISKASKGINLSEDIFAGFNWVLRGGVSTQADYLQCGKGRDTGVSQITGFTAKISMGEQWDAGPVPRGLSAGQSARLSAHAELLLLHCGRVHEPGLPDLVHLHFRLCAHLPRLRADLGGPPHVDENRGGHRGAVSAVRAAARLPAHPADPAGRSSGVWACSGRRHAGGSAAAVVAVLLRLLGRHQRLLRQQCH
ncbi:unnamed protein product, partial [Phaeothamnion confervicola]